jgi:hypothetical protein
MIPIILLHAILLWQHMTVTNDPATITASCSENGRVIYVHGQKVVQDDSTNHKTDESSYGRIIGDKSSGFAEPKKANMLPKAAIVFDVPPIVLHRGPEDGSGVTIRTCADNSRFLLFSEDGKFHCLALTGKP